MPNKKILYITPVLVPGSSAASKRIVANAKLLQLLNYDVSIYSGLNLADEKNVDGISIIPSGIGVEKNKGLKKLFAYRKSILHTIDKISKQDISNVKAIIVYSGYSFYLAPLIRWSKKSKIPIVFDAVEWYTPAKKIHWFLKPYFWNTEFAMQYFIPKTKNVIAISTYLEKYYKSKNCNTVVVPPLFYNKTTNKNKENSSYLQLSYTGSPGKKDNLNQILIAVLELNEENKNKKIKFEIAGINTQQLLSYPAFKDKKTIDLPNYFNAHGYISMHLAQEITSNSDFSILFRKNDKTNTAGFPTKVVESLSVGTPIFLNYSSDLHLYLHNYKNAIVIDNFSVKSIKHELVKMLNLTNSQLQEMREDAFNTAKNNFSIDAKKKAMNAFLNDLKI
jgi:glycosyltransferase involved in cell wall biosynthesis